METQRVETEALTLTLYHKTKRKLNQEIGTTPTFTKICGLVGMQVGFRGDGSIQNLSALDNTAGSV